MRLLFLDLETTVFPITVNYHTYHAYQQLAYYENSRIVQLAAQIYERIDDTGEFVLIREHNYIVRPDGFHITNENIHGIDQKTAETIGRDIREVITNLSADLSDVDLFIAHNVKFDHNILLSEMHRYNYQDEIKKLLAIPTFCTSEETTNIVRILRKKSLKKYKQPKLSELYQWLFKKQPIGLHNALNDIRYTSECFFALLQKKYFQLDR